MRIIKKIFKILLISHLICGLAAIVVIAISFLYIPDKLYNRAISKAPFDAVIVPGVPFENENWSKIMKMRVYWSYYLYKQGIAKNIIYSGGAVYTPYTESKIMALYAIQLRIPAANIFTESLAEHSTENLYYSYKLGKNKGFKTFALATDPFQNMMLWNFKEKVDPQIQMIPVVLDVFRKIPQQNTLINSDSALTKNFRSLVDRENFFERIKGTLGRKIKY